MARLIWRHPDGAPDTLALDDGEAVLGRGSGLDFVVDRKSVSRRHARIQRRGDQFLIEDLGSTNGTLVNGLRIKAPTLLNGGDVVQIGDEFLEFDDATAGVVTTGSLATEPLGSGRQNTRRAAFPQRVGKFHLRRKLGQGGMGAVFQALDLDSHREVAVKFIRSQIGRREAFLDYLYNREAVLAREVNHPNVIRIYEHGVHADQHYISMEFVSGANLSSVLRGRRLTARETLEILRQIACGLVAAHQKGVVHSDIKPANVLLAEELVTNRSAEAFPSGPIVDELPSGILEFDLDEGDAALEATAAKAYDVGLLQEIRSRIGATPQEALVDPPYFPRLPEMRFLRHYLERALDGRGYFLLVEGETGTGKGRLISEFLDPAALGELPLPRDGAPRVLELDCARIEGIPRLYSQVFPGRAIRNKVAPRELVRELAQSLCDEELPCVIRILNLGRVTALGSDLLITLSQEIEVKPLVLVAALSPEEIRTNGNLKPLLEKLLPVSKALYLRPLTEYQILKYVQQIYGEDPVAATVAADVYRLSDGNFGRVLDILRSFFERHILAVDSPSGGLQYRPRQQEFELQEGKNLYAKYRSLGSLERRLLEHAAFIGRRFPFELLHALSSLNETSLFFIVRTLLGDGFFEEEGRDWYRFTNRAFQAYMADRLPAAERPHLHRKVARLLGNTSVPESAELFEVRARHFDGCREYGKAVQSLLEGAYLARNEYRIEMSREMFQDILRIYRQLASRRKLRREVTTVLRKWFRRSGNWYELLGALGSEAPRASVKIADFGISFRQEDEDRGYQVERRPALGTPRYLSPERIRGEHGGPPCDIFSLGIILYEMAAGEAPFPDLKGKELLTANRTAPIRLSPEVLLRFPEGTERLLSQMVEKDPRHRWDAERVVREVGKLQLDLAHEERR